MDVRVSLNVELTVLCSEKLGHSWSPVARKLAVKDNQCSPFSNGGKEVFQEVLDGVDVGGADNVPAEEFVLPSAVDNVERVKCTVEAAFNQLDELK